MEKLNRWAEDRLIDEVEARLEQEIEEELLFTIYPLAVNLNRHGEAQSVARKEAI